MNTRSRIALFFATLLLPTLATAQTGPGMMLVPFAPQANFEGSAEATIFGSGTTNLMGNSFEHTEYRAEGRMLFNPEYYDEPITAGGRFVHHGFESSDARIPGPLTDVAGEVGTQLGTWEDYQVFGSVGAGYAGDGSLDDGDALYFSGNLFGVKQMSQTETLVVGINFDGNRVIWQDIPLPVLAYTKRESDTLSYTIGIPFASVRWQADDNLLITAQLPGGARAEYTVQEGVILYGAYENVTDVFTIEGRKNQRWFFQQQRVEGGVIYEACENASIFVAGGFAFETEFESGWDIRDTTTVAEISDEAYIRFGGQFWLD